MRVYDRGAFVTVTVSAREVQAFARRWPCSGLREHGLAFQFDKRNGDLVDLWGTKGHEDEGALGALADDAKDYWREGKPSPQWNRR